MVFIKSFKKTQKCLQSNVYSQKVNVTEVPWHLFHRGWPHNYWIVKLRVLTGIKENLVAFRRIRGLRQNLLTKFRMFEEFLWNCIRRLHTIYLTDIKFWRFMIVQLCRRENLCPQSILFFSLKILLKVKDT